MHRASLNVTERCSVQVSDAMMIAAASALNCDVFLSDDMHDGLVVYDRLTIRNPFAA